MISSPSVHQNSIRAYSTRQRDTFSGGVISLGHFLRAVLEHSKNHPGPACPNNPRSFFFWILQMLEARAGGGRRRGGGGGGAGAAWGGGAREEGKACMRERERERAFARLLLDPLGYISLSIYSPHGA
jgi:hypothetical protein